MKSLVYHAKRCSYIKNLMGFKAPELEFFGVPPYNGACRTGWPVFCKGLARGHVGHPDERPFCWLSAVLSKKQ